MIRLRRSQVFERRRNAIELEELAERLRRELQRLGERVPALVGTTEATFAHAREIRLAVERRQTLQQSLAEVEARISAARDALAQAVEEMSRSETLAANSERLRLQRIARQERAELEALGTQGVRRHRGRE